MMRPIICPAKPAGAGLLRVGSAKHFTRFQTAFAMKSYVPPQQAASAAVRQEAGYVEPQEFHAVGMPALQVHRNVGDDAPAVEPQAIIGPDGRTVKQVQATIASLNRVGLPPLAPMWLPPLEPVAVDELVRRLRGKPWDVEYGSADKLGCAAVPSWRGGQAIRASPVRVRAQPGGQQLRCGGQCSRPVRRWRWRRC